MRILKLVIKTTVLMTLIVISLSGCSTTPPKNPHNICAIFSQYPKWYWEAHDSYKKWGVPVSVQLAIIRQESHFQSDAKPPRKKLLGFIPWFRPTSAYGYAQALDGTWDQYQKVAKKSGADRDDFGDAADFVGWYSYRAHRKLGIPLNSAYKLYLAYHEGLGGYKKGSYKKKKWLTHVAHKVSVQAYKYHIQLNSCKNDIPKPSIWNLWLM